MQIRSFTFKDRQSERCIEYLEFHPVSLLVGASGVGKSQILRALYDLKKVVSGASLNGISAALAFTTLSGKNYRWEIAFSYQEDNVYMLNREGAGYTIVSESLYLEETLLVERTQERFLFRGKPLGRLVGGSALRLLQKEEGVKEAFAAVQRIYFLNYNAIILAQMSAPHTGHLSLQPAQALASFCSLEKIQESTLRTSWKLWCLQEFCAEDFALLQERFREIFTTVEAIRMVVSPMNQGVVRVEIKESGIAHWIHQEELSAGMLQTFIQLSILFLCPEGTVFLIDELENSFGVNCIDAVTEAIVHQERRLQFILTTHHPYIINNIDLENWRIIVREGGCIRAHKASDFRIGDSKHEAFMQLMQLESYRTGLLKRE